MTSLAFVAGTGSRKGGTIHCLLRGPATETDESSRRFPGSGFYLYEVPVSGFGSRLVSAAGLAALVPHLNGEGGYGRRYHFIASSVATRVDSARRMTANAL